MLLLNDSKRLMDDRFYLVVRHFQVHRKYWEILWWRNLWRKAWTCCLVQWQPYRQHIALPAIVILFYFLINGYCLLLGCIGPWTLPQCSILSSAVERASHRTHLQFQTFHRWYCRAWSRDNARISQRQTFGIFYERVSCLNRNALDTFTDATSRQLAGCSSNSSDRATHHTLRCDIKNEVDSIFVFSIDRSARIISS